MPRPAILVLALAALAAPAAARAQLPPVGAVDLYGVRRVDARRVREALGLRPGDPAPASRAAVDSLERRVAALPGVARAHVSGVCCEDGKTLVYVGIEETGGDGPRFRAPPDGAVRLPDDVARAGAALDAAREAAVRRGDAAEDGSAGHSLMHDSAARAIQERFVGFAARDLPRLRDVLAHAADARQRALAAQVIAYAADKRAVVADLVAATGDPSPTVRNDATRALALVALLAQRRPELGIAVPAAPFLDMLGSPVWTDRNKASLALLQLTERRDPTLLAALRARALPSLVEMARWTGGGHALPAFAVLGRVAGVAEDSIWAAWQRGDREAVIAAAIPGQTSSPIPPQGALVDRWGGRAKRGAGSGGGGWGGGNAAGRIVRGRIRRG